MERVYNVAHKVVVGGLFLVTVGLGAATLHDAGWMWWNRRQKRLEYVAEQERLQAQQQAGGVAVASGEFDAAAGAAAASVESPSASNELRQ